VSNQVSQHLPVAQIYAVQLPGDGPQQCIGRVTVRCPFCTQLHLHRVFDNDTIEFTRTAPCSTETSVRTYRVNLSLAVPKRDVSQCHPVFEAGNDLNDAAIDVPLPNWIE
jgi:hypothetical protein